MDAALVTIYAEASGFLVAAVSLVPPARWDDPGLGSWSLLELAGHADRGHTTVEDYLLRPQPPEPKDSPYFSDEAIAARGREAVAALGEDPVATIAATAARVQELVASTPLDAPLGSPVATMTLGDYLPSRVAELTIHGLDVVRALGAALPAPKAPLAESLAFVAVRAARRDGEHVLLALSGRERLAAGYSVF